MDFKHSALSRLSESPVQGGLIRPHHSKLLALARILDCLMICGTLVVALWLNQNNGGSQYLVAGLIAVLGFVFFSEYNDVYGIWRGSPMRREALRISASWVGVVVVLVILAFFSKVSTDYSRMVIGTWFIAAPVTILALHILRRLLLGYVRGQGRNTKTVAIIGANEMGERLSHTFSTMPWLGYKLEGYYDDRFDTSDNERRLGSGINYCGNFDDIYAASKAGKIDIIYITLSLRAEKRIKTLIQNLADSTVSINIVPDFFVFDLLHSRWSTIKGLPIISVFDTPFKTGDSFIKRAEDLILSFMIILLISIPMLCIALAIKVTSAGPIIFKQIRYGIHGDPIEVWKFRSMSVMENGDNIQQATKNDPRVTKLGAFLRKSSLDELPQFFNVLSGTMSIVGPRPHAAAHNEYYREQIQGYMLRHKVKPGITGLAQVNGLRGETDTIEKMEKRVQFDLNYIRNWSLSMDLKIIFKTIHKELIYSKAH